MEILFSEIDSEIDIKPKECPDPWFWTSTPINPYRGCQFNCHYCDGKANYYRIPNFGQNIRIKRDIMKNLTKSLYKLGYRKRSDPRHKKLSSFFPESEIKEKQDILPKFIISVGGGVTDAYQNIEKKKEITRNIVKTLIKFEFPAFFLTKSTLILRDLDLIGELNDRSYAGVNISVGYSDEKIRRLIEPHSASTLKRYEVLAQFREAGIPGGISMMPLAPFIGDSEENIDTLLRWASESKAEHALIAGLTLKPGNREVFFKEFLVKHFPQYIDDYKLIFPENNTYGIPKFDKIKIPNVTAIGHKLSKKYKIHSRIKRYIPDGVIKDNYLLAEHLYYVHYLLSWVNTRSHFFPASRIPKFACAIEKLQISIRNLTANERRELIHESEFCHEIADEYLHNNDSTLRKKFE